MKTGERMFELLARAYPRDFRLRYRDDLLEFFRHERRHPRYGSGPLRPLRFWTATVRDLARAAVAEHIQRRLSPAASREVSMSRVLALGFDLRNALRSLRSTPAATATALLVLAIGIGAGTAIFAVADGVMLRGLPYPDESTLVTIHETDLATGRPVLAAYPNVVEWAERQDVFEGLAVSVTGPILAAVDSERPERLRTHRISGNLLDVLRVHPAMGPGITPDDERNDARVAVLSDALWRRRFNADPAVLGRTIQFETGVYEIVGVMPPDFIYPIGPAVLSMVDVWIPYVPTPRERTRGPGRNYFDRVVARLKPGVSLDEARAGMTQIRDALAIEHPRWFVDRGITVRPLKDTIVSASIRSWMLMLLGAVAGVFLVACANVANLMLARASTRTREIGIRVAMGATRWQIVRGLLTESLVLALAGAAAGVCLAYWSVEVLRTTLPANLPRVWTIAVDLRVVGAAAAAAIATAALCGLVPALQSSRADVSSALRGSGRTATANARTMRVRDVFLVAEVALAAALLVCAGIFASSFVRLIRTDLGFESSRVFNIYVQPPSQVGADESDRARERERLLAGLEQALERIEALPGVESAAIVAGGAPLTGSRSSQPLHTATRTFTDDDAVSIKQVTPGYFETIGATLEVGRGLSEADGRGAPLVVVLNDEAVRRYLGQQEPLGARVRIDTEPERTVVGVVRGMRQRGPEADVLPEAFVPLAQTERQSVSGSFVVRTAGHPRPYVPAVKEAIWAALPNVGIPEPATFDEMYAGLIAQRKLSMILIVLFGALSMLIAGIGIYGVFAHFVAQRTREIGVRLALGAVPSRILALVLSRASLRIGAGLALGLLAATWLERLVMAFVFRGIRYDPLVYGSAVLLVAALGVVAAYVPARRAARVDPLVTLRAE